MQEESVAHITKVNTEQLLGLLRERCCVTPLHWLWSKTEKPIVLRAILRDLVNRRATFMADFQGQKSIVKLFYDKQGVRHARREVNGLELLGSCGVATSQVLYCTVLKEGALLVLSYLENTKPLSLHWDTCSDEDKKLKLSALLKNLQKMYAKGICQNDLHLDNVLVDDNQLYMVDGMGIAHYGATAALSMQRQFANLAEFFLELSFLDQKLLWQVLEADYFVGANAGLEKQLRKKITQESIYNQRKSAHKVWRNCTAFRVGTIEDYHYAVVADQKTALTRMFQQLTQNEDYFKFLKQGRTNTVFHYQWGTCNWVVKRYNIKSFWHGVMRSFRATRAAVSWQNANKLQLLHILTARPIGVLQKKWGTLRRQAYFVMEYIEGQSLHQYLGSLEDHALAHRKMIVQVVQVLEALKQNRLGHGDFKADNWWVCDDKLYLLDLDSLRGYRCKLFFKRAFNSDIQRFLKNWQDSPVLQQCFITAFRESKLL